MGETSSGILDIDTSKIDAISNTLNPYYISDKPSSKYK